MDSKRFRFTMGLFLLAILSSLGVFLSASIINGVENPADNMQPVQSKVVVATSADTIICGDVNGVGLPPYGNITLADAVYLWSFLFRGGPAPVPDTCVGDANGDGAVSVTDWMVPIKYLYKDTAPPVDYCCDSVMQKQLPITDTPGNRVTTDMLNNFLIVENTSARPGTQGHVINIFGSWNAELGAYGMVLIFDTSKIDIVEVSPVGTVGEEGMVVSNYLGNYSPLKAVVHLDSFIPPDSGTLFKVIVNVKETAPLGETHLTFINQPGEPPLMNVYSLSDGINEVLPELIHGTLNIGAICGDVNGDGEVTISDVTYLINYIYKGGPPPLCAPEPYLACGDVNSDGHVSVSDVVYLINYLYKGGPPSDCPATGTLVNYTDCKTFQKVSATDNISSDQDCIEYQYDGQSILEIKHINAGFNCCPDELLADITIVDNVITIEEVESLESGGCHCLCLFDLDLKIINLVPGEYTIRVIEPYVGPSEEQLEFTINLSSSPNSGIYCVMRGHYPWGTGK